MPELCVIVPTLNERDNVPVMVEAVDRALAGVDYEIVFVDDDSDDGTAAHARQIAQLNPRVRVIQRVGRKGLSSAAVEGMLATSAPYLAVMDGDMQHDERILPRMLDALRTSDVDLVVGTRNIAGGGMGDFAPLRVALSRAGRALSRAVCKTELSDPMSGFFVIRRTFLNEVVRNLSLTGFKILVDIVASAERPARVAEIPGREQTGYAGGVRVCSPGHRQTQQRLAAGHLSHLRHGGRPRCFAKRAAPALPDVEPVFI
jgi:dolichol-phosphate mannosyltransferase